MKTISKLAGLTCALLFCAGAAGADLAKPEGPVVLTIGGAVSESNAGAPDHFAASFLKSLEYSYEKAAQFDIAMLEALGMVEHRVDAEPWPRAVTLSGPKLSDVLDAAGWQGEKMTAVALDGFAVEITADDLKAHDWMLAIKGDGAYLPLGGRGPAWIVYDVKGGKGSEADEGRWPWAVFFILAE